VYNSIELYNRVTFCDVDFMIDNESLMMHNEGLMFHSEDALCTSLYSQLSYIHIIYFRLGNQK